MGLIDCKTLKNKRHWHLRWGQCEHCHAAAYRPSYDATRTLCVLGLPLLPLGRVHVHEDCQECRASEVYSSQEWHRLREQQLKPAQQAQAAAPQDANAASALLEMLSRYGAPEEFAALASDLRDRHVSNATILSQLAWCHGTFGDFESARDLVADSLAVREDPQVRRQAEAYATLPDTEEPLRPSLVGQWLTMLAWPLLLVGGLGLWTAFGLNDAITHAYVVNGLSVPYAVVVNGTVVTVPANGRQQVNLKSGNVEVRPVMDGERSLVFTPYQFAVTPGKGLDEPTVIINPDKAAVLSWEELVYQHKESETLDGLADQFAFHTGDPFYDFRGVTDHFVDPPEAVEVRSDSAATYRYLIKLVDLTPPVEVASVLLSYGEVELAAVYARNLLIHDPSDYDVLEMLVGIAPNGETLEFMKPYLEQKPLFLPWHLAHQELQAQLMPEVDQVAYYEERLRSEPGNKAILHLLGIVSEDPEISADYWRRAAEPPNPVFHAIQALALRAMNEAEFERALDYIGHAEALVPGSPVFEDMAESCLIAQNRFNQLILRYIERVRADPLDQAAAMTLAGLYEASGANSEAQGVVESFVRAALENDASLDPQSLEGLRLIFQGVMARWIGDADKFIEVTDELGEGDWTMSALLLKGKLDLAVQYIGETKDDPFIFLTLYALTLTNGQADDHTKAEEHLAVALKAFEADSHWRHVIVPWFQTDVEPPSLQDTLNVRLDNADRRVLLAALGCRHPELREACFDLARKLNHDRSFPYLVLKRLLK